MPKKEKTKEENAPMKTSWSSEDKELLISTLLEEKRKGTWGDNNPKRTTWVACEAALRGSEKATNSCHKDIASIKSCWQRVSASLAVECMRAQGYMQLKQSYDRVKHICKQSGWGWNHKKNLPKVGDETWNNYVKVSNIPFSYMIMMRIYSQAHPKSKQWCTKPFPLYFEMAELVHGSHASGERKYIPGREETPVSCSIPIDTILLEESMKQGKLSSDTDSDSGSDICTTFLILASFHYQCTSRAMPPRTKTRPIVTTNPKIMIVL